MLLTSALLATDPIDAETAGRFGLGGSPADCSFVAASLTRGRGADGGVSVCVPAFTGSRDRISQTFPWRDITDLSVTIFCVVGAAGAAALAEPPAPAASACAGGGGCTGAGTKMLLPRSGEPCTLPGIDGDRDLAAGAALTAMRAARGGDAVPSQGLTAGGALDNEPTCTVAVLGCTFASCALGTRSGIVVDTPLAL